MPLDISPEQGHGLVFTGQVRGWFSPENRDDAHGFHRRTETPHKHGFNYTLGFQGLHQRFLCTVGSWWSNDRLLQHHSRPVEMLCKLSEVSSEKTTAFFNTTHDQQ
ncbi:hypothetical protein L1987_87940 [Smallanthus sonchifolius]|nr:hypothetical protein L1987_87940 [Smallanthus sonchifolius]